MTKETTLRAFLLRKILGGGGKLKISQGPVQNPKVGEDLPAQLPEVQRDNDTSDAEGNNENVKKE